MSSKRESSGRTAPVATDAEPVGARERLKRAIIARFNVRTHMSLILAACFLTGLVVTKLLLMAGVHSMVIRYALMLAAAYGTFLLGVRIWLAYAGYAPNPVSELASSLADKKSGSIDLGGSSGRSGGGSGGGSSGRVGGGGGSFDGGGASGNWVAPSGTGSSGANVSMAALAASDGDSATQAASAASTTSGSSGGDKGGGGFDLDGDGFVIIAFIAVVAAICGACIYAVYAAPTILADAAFAGALSGGLHRATRQIDGSDWLGSVIRNTWIAFAIVFVFGIAFAAIGQHNYPEAQTLHDVLLRAIADF